MDNIAYISTYSIVVAGTVITVGTIAPAIAQCKAIIAALTSLAQQPDEAATITRTLFVGLAMIESMAIYCFVIAMVLLFANPFWNHVAGAAAKAAH